MLYAGHGRILYVGGISGCGLMSSENEIVEFDCNRVTVSAVRTRFRKENTPFLIGHSVVLLQDRVVICGGGGECFGFGTCMNDGLWTLSDSEKDDSWQIIEEGQGMEVFHDMDTAMPDTPWEVANECYGPLYQVLELKRVGISSAEDFREIVESSEPTLLEGVDFGPCVKVWTPEYLKATIGDEREVVVRLAESSAMSPQRFKTQKMLFREFIDIAFSPNLFVCSLSAGEDLTLPSAGDFPGLAQDFILPSSLAIASNNHHSYQLEITSADVGISLRYHVLAKILCLVSGHLSVRLYPPGNLAKLSFPHGATTSSMPNIFAQESPPGTSPYDVDLNPGDILFIPPVWLHSAKSLTACTAINVFFKDPTNPHEAKLHPDRDLTAYGEGRKKLRGIAKDFQHLPRDVRRFYLSRLAEELKELDE
jgi:tRNA wybutosine-synthesizing protein 4